MSKVLCLAALAVCFSFGVVGCNSNKDKSSDEPKMMSNDACAHCPGVQKASDDGKCPICGMKAKS